MDGKAQRADYGVDAPGVIRNLCLAGIAALALDRFLPSVNVGGVTFLLSPMCRNMAFGFLLGGVLMLLYSKFMKFGHRDRMLRMVDWRGDERVLKPSGTAVISDFVKTHQYQSEFEKA